VATYLAALDQLFDEQANLLREQTHRAEQAELAVRIQQIRAAHAEARAAAAVSSEAVAQESLRQARDRRMQDWTLFGSTRAPPENPGSSAATDEGDAAMQPLTDGNPEDGE
jgi:septal ring factor EnvC (AmiA/AmiB activator)